MYYILQTLIYKPTGRKCVYLGVDLDAPGETCVKLLVLNISNEVEYLEIGSLGQTQPITLNGVIDAGVLVKSLGNTGFFGYAHNPFTYKLSKKGRIEWDAIIAYVKSGCEVYENPTTTTP